MKTNRIQIFSVTFLLALGFSSCIKKEDKPLGDAGIATVKLLEAPERKLFYSPFTDTRKIDLFSVRRDDVSQSGNQQPITVTVLRSPDSLNAYNTAHGTTYEPLPDSLYTLVSSNVTKSGNNYTFVIPGGVAGSELSINLNGAKWDVSHKYGAYFILTDPGGRTITSGKKEIFVTIEAKNRWDGVYEITSGTLVDLVSPTLSHINNFLAASGDPNMQYELRTISPTKCELYDNYFFGGYYYPITSGASYSRYGDFQPIFEFDPATNQVIAVTNKFGQPAPSNTRSGRIDPSGENVYDPATKTIKIKYFIVQPSSVPTPPNVRVMIDETYKYIGPRG